MCVYFALLTGLEEVKYFGILSYSGWLYMPASQTLASLYSQVNSFYFTVCKEVLKWVSISCLTLTQAKVKQSWWEYCQSNEQLCLFHKLRCDEILIWIYFLRCNKKEEIRSFALNWTVNLQPVFSLLLFLNSENNARDTLPPPEEYRPLFLQTKCLNHSPNGNL